jgi:hypothetical protein
LPNSWSNNYISGSKVLLNPNSLVCSSSTLSSITCTNYTPQSPDYFYVNYNAPNQNYTSIGFTVSKITNPPSDEPQGPFNIYVEIGNSESVF